RFVGQYPALDRDGYEWRLGGELGTRHHDLVDFRSELLHRRGEYQAPEVTPQDRAHAHRARLAGCVERTAAHDLAAVPGDAAADRDHLAVRSGVVVPAAEVASARENAPLADDDRPERKVAAPGLRDGD